MTTRAKLLRLDLSGVDCYRLVPKGQHSIISLCERWINLTRALYVWPESE